MMAKKNLAKIINKELKFEGVRKGLSLERDAIKYSPTGIYTFDKALGGGFPVGRITEIYGPEGAGKSLMCLYGASQALTDNKVSAWFDLEGALDPQFIEFCGLGNVLEDLFIYERNEKKPYSEVVWDGVHSFLRAKVDYLCIDSVAALMSKTELEAEDDQKNFAASARVNNPGLRKANALNVNTALIFINQLRAKIGGYSRGKQEEPGGGNAFKFFASLRIEIRIVERIYPAKTPSYIDVPHIQNKPTGHRVRFKVIKSKVGHQNDEGYFDFFYGYGIDMVHQKFQELLDRGKIVQNGRKYHYKKKDYNRNILFSRLAKKYG